MSYKKILVDNPVCSRRFHIAFDDEGEKQKTVEVKCLHCGALIFARKDHPSARLLRDENLVKETELSSVKAFECDFKDQFSPAPQPKT